MAVDSRHAWRASADLLELDTRWLALHRIVFGVLLVVHVATVASNDRLVAFFTDEGMLPFSALEAIEPVHAAATPFRWVHTETEATFALASIAALGVLLALGFGTRLVAPLAALALIAMHHRITPVVNASMATMHLLVLPWCLLPLGRHFSIDALLAARRGMTRPALRLRTLAPLILRLQLAVIYFFNALHKGGETWLSGDAVHYVLYSSRAVWPHTVAFRDHEPAWFSPLLTYGALAMEWALPLALLLPFRRRLLRNAAAAMMVALHGGICVLADLGPFPFVFGMAVFMLFGGEPADRLPTRLGGGVPAEPETLPGARRTWPVRVREGTFAGWLAVNALLLWPHNWALRSVLGDAQALAPLDVAMRHLFVAQAWSMFAPEAPTADRVLVPVAVLTDGRRIVADSGRRPRYRGLDEHYTPVDFFLQIYESEMVVRNHGALFEAYTGYYARLAVRRGFAGPEQVERLEVDEFTMTRPPRVHREPWVTYSRVLLVKTLQPQERPVERGP